MSYISFSLPLYGFVFEGTAEIEPSEPSTDISPGWPTIATIVSLNFQGNPTEALPIVSPDIVAKLEEIIREAQ